MKWLLTHTKKWHAWPRGGTRSKCGTVTFDYLRTNPAKRISSTPPPEGANICGSCNRGLTPADTVTVGKHPLGAQAAAWLALLNKHLIRVRVQVKAADKRDLAMRLASVGATSDPAAGAVYEQIKALLLTPRRHRRRDGVTVMKIMHLRKALDKLPPSAKALQHVAESMQLWRRITGRDIGSGEHFRPDTVIESMLEVPAPEAYIHHLHSKGLSNLALMFHPNTLEKRKSDPAVRGVFGGSTEYWKQTTEQLAAQTVTE